MIEAIDLAKTRGSVRSVNLAPSTETVQAKITVRCSQARRIPLAEGVVAVNSFVDDES